MLRPAKRVGALLVVALFAASGAVAGCTSGTADGAADQMSGAVTEGLEESTSPSDAAATEKSENADSKASEGAGCLVGSWTMDNASFENAMKKLLAESGDLPGEIGADMSIALTGDSWMDFKSDGTFESHRDGFKISMTVEGTDVAFVTNAEETGLYGADATHLWLYDTEIVSMDYVMDMGELGTVAMGEQGPGSSSAEIFGQTVDIPTEAPGGTESYAAYTCSGDQLIITAEDEGGAFDVVLNRRG